MNPQAEITIQEPPQDSASPAYEGPLVVPPERMPDVSNLVIRDDTPVESFFAERQYRLLTGPLYDSWAGPGKGRPFLATANVGLFYRSREPPVIPDAMLALDIRLEGDPLAKENNTYFLWEFGKPPDVVIEVVSDRRAGEDTTKMERYTWIGVPHYVIFDPGQHLSSDVLRSFILTGGVYRACPNNWFKTVGLGVKLWEGMFEGHPKTWWLRWCDEQGEIIPTGGERAQQERQRADQEQQRADREQQRADREQQRADREQQSAEQERQRAERLEAFLRERGIEPPS